MKTKQKSLMLLIIFLLAATISKQLLSSCEVFYFIFFSEKLQPGIATKALKGWDYLPRHLVLSDSLQFFSTRKHSCGEVLFGWQDERRASCFSAWLFSVTVVNNRPFVGCCARSNWVTFSLFLLVCCLVAFYRYRVFSRSYFCDWFCDQVQQLSRSVHNLALFILQASVGSDIHVSASLLPKHLPPCCKTGSSL